MHSNKYVFLSFIHSFNYHYQARLQYMTFPRITKKILNLLQIFYDEKLIQAFFIYSPKTSYQKNRFSVYILFRYVLNSDRLFRKLKTFQRRIPISKQVLQFWIKKKASLAFPLLVISTPNAGLFTDRQLFYLQLKNKLPNYMGGELLLTILP